MKIKKLILQLINWFKNVFLSAKKKQEAQLDNINEVLFEALQKEEIKRALLKRKVNRYVKRYHSFSKFIPGRKFNRHELRQSITEKYGEEMNDLSLKLSNNLTWE